MTQDVGEFDGENRSPYTNNPLTIEVAIPARDANLYAQRGTDDILYFLANRPYEEFAISQLAGLLGLPRETTRRAINVLEENELITSRPDGKARPVRINRDRLNRPEDPIIRIPQSQFHEPVRAAVEELTERLENVVAILLYGSVARGEADRMSDIDLWVLVDDERIREQNRALDVGNELEEERFNQDRYEFQIGVESTQSVPSYTQEIRDIVSSGLPVYKTEEYEQIMRFLENLSRDE